MAPRGDTIVGASSPSASSIVMEASDLVLGCAVRVIGILAARRLAFRKPGPMHLDFTRLTACAAAWRRHGASIVVSLGPQTSLDVVTGDGEYLGGIEAPGFPESTLAARPTRDAVHPNLWSRGAQLRAGLDHGLAAMIFDLLRRLRMTWRDLRRLHVVATGGFA